MRTSIATVSLAGSLSEKLRAAAAAGFDAVEVFEPDLLASPLRPAEVRALAGDLGLAVALFQPFRDPDDVDPAAAARSRERLRHKAALTRELGCDLILVCSSVHAGAVHDDDELAAQLTALADVAAGEGVRLAYEALAWGAHVADYRHGARVVALAGHPALGTCVDSFHVLSRGDDPDDIAGLDKLFFCQVADAPLLGMDVLPWSRHHRLFPGQGGFDLARFQRAVTASGYGGPVSLEVFNDLYRQSDPGRAAVDAARSLRHLADLTAPGTLPAAPSPSGWAFVEVAASAEGAPAVAALLGSLGLARTGAHRRGDVDLWTGGDVRVVVNHRASAERARLSSLGLRSDAPQVLAARARELLAPLVHRPVGPGEAEIPSLVAPDGTWVQFCGDDPDWRGDFLPTGEAATARSFTGIDHVALPQPFAGFDSAGLFLTTVLGMSPGELAEVAAPDGLVRSRAYTSTAGIRIALNVGPTSATLRGRPLASGHVALATTDVLAVVAAFVAAGGEPLPVPVNYHDDLQARFGLDKRFLDALRRHHVLYDRDPDGGEFLHFFTRAVSREFFVEVVERRGGYRGYGAANTPVRLAAQREHPAPGDGSGGGSAQGSRTIRP
ncbi:sugar phosphate isomerase/epimerase and 4-hydroxyphenylpyruvate domain-containing protein [Kineococcus rhizosphaerae]|uniref:3-dehydroshikimate dehydratase n=1 Tax=Kineococcus rhizosphaerae TaxID=559628 RepID=A0A2T0RBJ6_9ACTN|nr:sugar phosphate isomerase/epimerase and 4-hydroxyphenylpyruvate domain-containing protein [Kineococcus rhizosphaerae]PRY18511.1 4-hydroxyphenylpyruvate dioxygenase [Kineococcus rhizosphaerae]